MTATTVSLYGFEVRERDNRRTGRPHTYDIQQLWQRSHEILGMALQGMKQKEIAQLLNISEATVSNTLNSTLGKEKLSAMREGRDGEYVKLSERIKKLTHQALDTYNKLLETPSVDDKIKKETADTIVLDVAGMRAPVKTESKSLSIHATVDEIEEFKQRGLEAARESGFLVEVEDEGNVIEVGQSDT